MKRAGQIRVGHPCVLDSIGCGEEDGKWYLVMPFVDGVDLEIFVRACGGRCPVDRAIPIICALADGLGAVHNCGTVHRDIKPLNIIITPGEHPMIIDFGICRNVHEKTIGNGQVIGTPAYMSPEQPAQAGARFSTCCGVNLLGPKRWSCVLHVAARPTTSRLAPACQRSFSSANHRFVFDSGSVTGKTFRIPEGTFVVGRDIIESRDFSISRRHFRVECNNGTVRVQDAGSTNKTYVAGQLADRLIQLRPDQEFLIAGNRAVYLSR
jgi:serine/threonine protein kinase